MTLQSSVGQLIFNFIQVSSPSFYPPVGSDAQTSLRGFLQLAPPLCSLSFSHRPFLIPQPSGLVTHDPTWKILLHEGEGAFAALRQPFNNSP